MILLPCPHHSPPYSYYYIHHPSFSPYRNPNFTAIPYRNPYFTAASSSGSFSGNEQQLLRQHNAKNSSILQNPKKDAFPEQDKLTLLEMSLVTKRTPKFPGSIYVQSPSDTDVNSSLPPLNNVFRGENDNDEMAMMIRAVEIRRKVSAEIFKEEMRKGKFGITYYSNLTARVPVFIDYVMIKAAMMKKLAEFKDSTFNVRARTVIEDSGVVPLIRWLKHNSLSYPQIGKLICMSKGNIESIRRYTEWLKTIHVKGDFIGVALTKAEENILDRSIEELNEIVSYLESKGVRRDWMGQVMSRCPKLLSYSMEEVKSRVRFYLDMGMNENDFGTMVFEGPRALGYFTMEEMHQKVSYLKEFGISNEDVRRLLAFKPQLMSCSIEDRWKPLVKYLYYLGVTQDGMRRILLIKPMVFCVDLESTIVPKVIFLMANAGVTQSDIAKVIALGPELLGCSIVNKLEVNVKYFLSLGIRLRQLGEMIADFPMLLRYNIELLRPKYRYLRRTMVRPLEDLIEFPRFFSYSLDGRIIPRYKKMVENRVNFKLRYMLANTDEEFHQRVEDAVERRHRFESDFSESEVVVPDNEQLNCLESEEQTVFAEK